ncbi:hypothetical protein [Aquimarina sp. I32.4]|uniref:hypothetical protein n=1 Tax=Aquimarina sp. I32.4 TaxID=2053903 RepID=UPI000CDF08DA|nr:hypothetical protein [Aquimarina sp. I32.4]
MINQIAGFIFRLCMGILAFIGGVFVILYTILFDFVREKILRKKPIESCCLTDDIHKDDTQESEKKKSDV